MAPDPSRGRGPSRSKLNSNGGAIQEKALRLRLVFWQPDLSLRRKGDSQRLIEPLTCVANTPRITQTKEPICLENLDLECC
jgi:hypothetical protein